jgi:hypothetical protein
VIGQCGIALICGKEGRLSLLEIKFQILVISLERQRKRAILFAATLLCARKLIETIESNSRI